MRLIINKNHELKCLLNGSLDGRWVSMLQMSLSKVVVAPRDIYLKTLNTFIALFKKKCFCLTPYDY